MPRRKNLIPSIEKSISIPETIITQVDILLIDPLTGKVKHSAYSKLVTRLLKEWLKEQQNDNISPSN